ncbi:MAG: helix-turn-helix domain-containing protein [Lachnospiraceae bacterium]|nr:helix-turn-helix domain-containing protein [Lachnospiraceae bacterium]
MTIGERIIKIIKEKGMTQKEFSEMTGIPQSTMSTWKSKKQTPGMDKLQIICDVLDVDPYFLVAGTEGENTKTVDYLRISKNDQEYKLIIEYRELDDNSKNRLLGYLQALEKSKE